MLPIDVLVLTHEQIRNLTPRQLDLIPSGLPAEAIQRLYEAHHAYWQHSGDVRDPHVILASGKHSNCYFNSALIVERAPLIDALARQFMGRLSLLPPDRVVGPSYGSNFFVAALARQFGCYQAYTEAEKNDSGKGQVWTARWVVRPGSRVLLAEDVITTGGSVFRSHRGVHASNPGDAPPEFHPFIACLVNRSGQTRMEGFTIISLLAPQAEAWEPAECPLCQQGSRAIANAKHHWAELTARAAT